MTIEEFLVLLEEKGFKILCGMSELKREVISINMMENPDTLKWIKPGEFLLTTGYFMSDNEELQLNFIRELSNIGAAGVGVKKNRYISKLTERVLEEAKKLLLPIIEIPYEYSLSDVSSMFYKELYERQTEKLRKSLNIHEQFMNIVLTGGSIEELGSELERLIDNPLLISNEHGEIIANKNFYKNKSLPKELFFEYNKEPMLNIEFIGRYYNNIHTELPKEAIKYNSVINGNEVSFRIKPIVSDREIYGYIIVAETGRKMIELDYMAIERSSVIIMLERMKQKAIDEAKQLMRRDFFDELLEGKIHSERELEGIVGIYGLNNRFSYSCMVTEIKDINNTIQYHLGKNFVRQLQEDVIKIIDYTAMKEKIKTISITRGSYIITFIPFMASTDSKENREFLVGFGKIIEKEFNRKNSEYAITIGIGKSYKIIHLSKSFKEAMEARKLINKLKGGDKVVHFDDFMIYHLLNAAPNTDVLKSFYDTSIKKLVEYDNENNTNLVETLDMYFKSKGNMSQSAKMLFIHRNTLLYRLDKIKEILETDLEDGEKNLELQLGIHIMKLL